MVLTIASQMEDGFNQALAAHPAGPTIIAVPEETPWAVAGEADILIIRPSLAWRGAHHLPRPANWPGRLRWVYSASVGVDFYPAWLLDAPLVTCGRGVASDEIADYVLAAILSRAKNLVGAQARSRSDWVSVPLGRINAATIGIIGLGAIGTAVAQRAAAFGAHIVGVRRSGRAAPEGVTLVQDVEALVAQSDHIVVAAPATAQTHHLLNVQLLAKAKPGAHIVNIARGSLIDQEALIDALDSGRIDFATLDVTEPEPLPDGHPLYVHPRVRLTPHISSNYTQVRHRLLEKMLDDLGRFVRGEAPSDIVEVERGY